VSGRRVAAASTTRVVTPTAVKKLYYHLTLLAESDLGYRNLIQLSSLAFMEGYYYKPRIDWELLEKYHHGLIATTGCLGGHVLQSLLRGDEKGAMEKAGRLQEIFGKRQPVRRAPGSWTARPSVRPTRS
jgi:DNA polymerase III alpha subunit